MKRSRALALSLGVAVAAATGVVAATSSIALGDHTRTSSDQQVARRIVQLDRFEASLRKALAEKPPPPPALSSASGTPMGAPSIATTRVIYRRAVSLGAGAGTRYDELGEPERDGSGEREHEGGEYDDE